jgi:hypothetical protein
LCFFAALAECFSLISEPVFEREFVHSIFIPIDIFALEQAGFGS